MKPKKIKPVNKISRKDIEELEYKFLMSALNDTTLEDILVKSILRNRVVWN